ncbi:MAG TPA: asparagine synthase C-terminal domain-containing protein [Acidimicrobiia bacterium]
MSRDLQVTLGPRRAWSTVGTTRATGFAFRGETLLGADDLAAVIDAAPAEGLQPMLRRLTGSFAAIRESRDGVDAIVDDIRGIPLYSVEDGSRWIVTDDPLHVAPDARRAGSSWTTRAELLKSSFVSGIDTLLDAVHEAEAGAFLRIPSGAGEPLTSCGYYTFEPNVDPDTSGALVDAGLEVHRAAVERTIRFADGALIVVPLSAGLDSGILAALLSTSGLERDQILTFTFGQSGNRESEVSRRVADALGLRWTFVPYTEAMWQDVARQSRWPGYLAWASSLAAAPGFTDIPAVSSLREQELVPEGSVVVPGHTLGFLAGSFIPGGLARRRRGSRADVIDAILRTYYKYRSDDLVATLVGVRASEVAEALRERVDHALPATPASMPPEQLVGLTEQFGWKERQAKMIVNGVRAYEDQGLRWAVPWWDREVIDFWSSVPLEQRVGQRLRRELAQRVGWPEGSRSRLDSLQERVERNVRMLRLDGPAKKVRNLARRATRHSRYHDDELACLALFGEERFLASYTGTQVPRAFLSEDVLSALDR